MAESGEQGEKCVSVGGRLNEAPIFDDGCRGAYGVSSLVLVLLIVGDCLVGRSFLFLSTLWVDALPFPGSLGASIVGMVGPAGLEVTAVEEAEEPVLVIPVCLLEVYGGKAETGKAGEECVSL